MDQNKHQSANLLINESSPYLLQHAYNPVNWRPWNQKSLEEAKKTNKALLISIGYSACHWCHVMERESFEDPEIAQLMNDNFICIKVDREERPDIDHLYMDAVQLMNGNGGWPLNCFALPDGKPFYGGTYFAKEQWKSLLLQLSELYKNEHDKVVEYAEKLSNGIRQNELIEKVESPSEFEATLIEASIEKWKTTFDPVNGGNNSAPKFPMPNNYEFLLHYYYHTEDLKVQKHLELSLRKMAYGGIYDQIGGGFARYSTDMEWKVPHFEKMLYDNAQLISLYAKAYKTFQDPLYKNVIEESIAFLNKEMLDESGAYYSALDADSEGEEGKFYIWSLSEIQDVLSKDDYELAKVYYNFNPAGEWEGSYIPLRTKRDDEIAAELGLSEKELRSKIAKIRSDLYDRRNKRVRPGLDDKSLTSWNALTIIALLDAYEALDDNALLKYALNTAKFIKEQQLKANNELFHSYKNGKSTINGFLEDYAFTIEAFIKLYENTFDPTWLNQSEKLVKVCLDQFYDEQSSYFYFNSIHDPELISRKIEKDDNVIPASNSSLCKGLYKLGSLLANEEYLEVSDQMLANSLSRMTSYLPYSTNWADQLLIRSKAFYEIAVVGEKATQKRRELIKEYLPNSIFLGEEEELNSLELLEGKWVNGKSYIYVCMNKSCKKPLEDVQSAIQELRD